MTADLPWVRLRPAEWLRDVRWMKPSESHVFTILTMLMLDAEEPLADDRPRLARYSSMTRKTFDAALEALLARGAVWRTDAGELMTDYVTAEVAFRDRKRRDAKKAIEIRWKNANENSGRKIRPLFGRNTEGGESEREREREGRVLTRPYSESLVTQRINGSDAASRADPSSFRVGQVLQHRGDSFKITEVAVDRVTVVDRLSGQVGNLPLLADGTPDFDADTDWTLPPPAPWEASQENDVDDDIPF